MNQISVKFSFEGGFWLDGWMDGRVWDWRNYIAKNPVTDGHLIYGELLKGLTEFCRLDGRLLRDTKVVHK